MLNELKAPPHSDEAEQHVLGGLLLQPSAYDRIDWLRTEAFYRADHREIFKTLASMIEANRPVDTFTVANALNAKQEQIAYLGSLAVNTPSAANIRRYAEIVRDKHILRQLACFAAEVGQSAYEPGQNPRELAQEAEAKFLSVLDVQEAREPVAYGEAVTEALAWREEPRQGLSTGLPDLDRMLGGGMKPQELIIVAGRPSMGKSGLALCIAEHVAAEETVAFFTLEMSRRQVANRSLRHHETLLEQSEAVRHLHSLKMTIDDTPAVGIAYLRLRLRRIRRQRGLGLVVVDYLQLLTAKGENRTQEVSEISRGLKAIGKEFDVPVLAVCQLSRKCEERTDRRPIMSDLRETGQIEQDADVVVFVYRDEYYNQGTAMAGLAELLIRKNRDGETGTVTCKFTPETTRFHTYDGAPIYQIPVPRKRSAIVRVGQTFQGDS